MTYYPDETVIPETSQPPGDTPRLAAGWLDADHDFRQGECPEPVVRRLEDAVREPVGRTRSWYQCPLCPLTGMGPTVHTTPGGEELLLGNATVEVPGRDGRLWRLPSLVLHYVGTHDYLPPDALLEDVAAAGGA